VSGFLKRDDCFLVVVDIQKKLHAAMEDTFKEIYVKNCVILIETAKAIGLPIVVSEQYPRGLGPTIDEIAVHLVSIPRLEKLFFSCYREGGIKSAIQAAGRKTAVVIGIETHVCVMQTVLDLMDAGYFVIVASDAVCSRRLHDMHTALDAMARSGVFVYSTEAIAFMLMEKAGTELFKQLSPLFK
jgi:nicotinamidase-related amidase